jgi:hypothetical protein
VLETHFSQAPVSGLQPSRQLTSQVWLQLSPHNPVLQVVVAPLSKKMKKQRYKKSFKENEIL